ncbi:MAG: hypothetical protein SFV23_01280 [Planctomycetaceae bacterium]|nr:hypothetical protein [Planctomycetaceae bacterium]
MSLQILGDRQRAAIFSAVAPIQERPYDVPMPFVVQIDRLQVAKVIDRRLSIAVLPDEQGAD